MKKSIIISTIIVVILLAGYAVNHFSYSTSSSEIETAWQAYEGFNNNLLDKNKYIYKTNTSYSSNMVSTNILGYGYECLQTGLQDQ